MRGRKNASLAVRKVSLMGMMAAMLTGGKLALAVIPNVEIVTLLSALYGYVFGGLGILAILVFVTVEPLLWGVGTWVISYYLYWPFVGLVFFLFCRLGVKRCVPLTAAALLLTVWFGVLTSLVDIGLFMGYFDRFFERFAIYYMRGIVFYIVQLACNAVTFPLLFPPLSRTLFYIKGRFFPEGDGTRRRTPEREEDSSLSRGGD